MNMAFAYAFLMMHQIRNTFQRNLMNELIHSQIEQNSQLRSLWELCKQCAKFIKVKFVVCIATTVSLLKREHKKKTENIDTRLLTSTVLYHYHIHHIHIMHDCTYMYVHVHVCTYTCTFTLYRKSRNIRHARNFRQAQKKRKLNTR